MVSVAEGGFDESNCFLYYPADDRNDRCNLCAARHAFPSGVDSDRQLRTARRRPHRRTRKCQEAHSDIPNDLRHYGRFDRRLAELGRLCPFFMGPQTERGRALARLPCYLRTTIFPSDTKVIVPSSHVSSVGILKEANVAIVSL